MKIKNAVCYSFRLNDESLLGYVRLIGPLRQSGINIINGIENNQIIINRASEGDVVIVQREFPQKIDSYNNIMKLARKEGKPVVFDLDDLLFYLPENHPDRQSVVEYGPSLLPMFQALMEADLVSVSTPKLRDVLADYNDNIVVLPNYFDDKLWRLTTPVRKNSSREMLTIGYMGTYTHKPDVEYITPVLLDLIKRYPQKLRFLFWGVQPPAQLESLPQVKWVQWYSDSYKDFTEFFQTQSVDIFIAPLVDNLFNRCKSPIKFFEYSALGAPGVFSRLDPYADVITHGHNGLLASSLDEWKDCLIQLVENDELRFQSATNAQATIRKNWLLSQNAFRRGETFQSALDIISSNKKQNNAILSIVKSINLILFDTFNKKAAEQLRTEARAQQAEDKAWYAGAKAWDAGAKAWDAGAKAWDAEAKAWDAEAKAWQTESILNAVYNSRSWKVTAPLRWIAERLRIIRNKFMRLR